MNNAALEALFPELKEALTLLESVQRPEPSFSPTSKNKTPSNLVVEQANTQFDKAKRSFLTFLQGTIEGNTPDIPETGFPALQQAMEKIRQADMKLGQYMGQDDEVWEAVSAKFIEKIDPLHDVLGAENIRVILEGRKNHYLSEVLSRNASSVASNNNNNNNNNRGSVASTIAYEGEEQEGEEQEGGRRRRSKKARKTKRKQCKSRKAKRKQRKTRRR